MPTYTYTADTPLGAQGMNVSQPIILQNFKAIEELVAVNHVGFNIPDTFGKHKTLTMEYQTEDPETGSSDLTVYTKPSEGPNEAEIYYRYPNNGEVMQLSGSTGTAAATVNLASVTNGACTFPSGLVMAWGTQVAPTIVSSTGVYPNNITAYVAALNESNISPLTLSSWSFVSNTGTCITKLALFPNYIVSSSTISYINVGGISNSTNTINYLTFTSPYTS